MTRPDERSSYRAVLRVPHARPLVFAALVGRLSFGMGPLALVLVVQHATGSFARAGLVAATTALTSGLLAPVRGRLVDRYGQQRCLPWLAIGYAAGLLGVLGAARLSAIGVPGSVVMAGLAGAAAPPLAASTRVLWVSLVGRGAQLQTAYALDAALEEALFTIGPLLTGALTALLSPAAALAASAGLALAGTAAFLASPVSRTWQPTPTAPVGWAGALRAAGLRTLVVSLAGVGAAVGVFDIGLVAAARQTGSPATGGVLLAVLAAGSAAGGLWYGARTWRQPVEWRFLWLLGLLAFACLPMAAARSLLWLGLIVAAVGLLLGPLTCCANVLTTQLAPTGTLTEAATWVTTAQNVTAAAGIALAGILVDQAGVPWTLRSAWVCTTAALLVSLIARRTLTSCHSDPERRPS